MPTVVLVGTLDTKGTEYAFVRDRLRDDGVDVLTVDSGVLSEPTMDADIGREQVAAAGGVPHEELRHRADRGAAVRVMADGAEATVKRLFEEGRIDGALALGGTGGTSIAAQAFRALPLGVPKLVVSTAASGDTRAHIGETDLILAPSVVDIAGLNRISRRVLANAAAAIAGMVKAKPLEVGGDRPLVAASMFGVTTPCVTAARALLEQRGYEVLVFHMTGTGGRALEALATQGLLSGVLDVTTTELADELLGGIFSAGPRRLFHRGPGAVPRVASVGALDMVNFGPMDTVPPRFAHRNLYVHNPTTTLMRTTPDECAELGRRLAARLAEGNGPVTVFLPLGGVSAISTPGGPFYDPDADDALFDAIRDGLRGSPVELIEMTTDVNDPTFAAAMVQRLDAYINDPDRRGERSALYQAS